MTEGGGRAVYLRVISHAFSFVPIQQIYEKDIPDPMLWIAGTHAAASHQKSGPTPSLIIL